MKDRFPRCAPRLARSRVAPAFGLLLAGLLTAFVILSTPSVAVEETTTASGATQITSLPYTISSPGVYILEQDFLSLNLAGGVAIHIDASDVVLDLNGHTISNVTAGTGTVAYGVLASDRSNVTVRNGTVQGFMTGVAFTASDLTNPGSTSYGNLVERLGVNGCTYEGVSVAGANSVVRSCQMQNIGGSTLLGDLASAYGIDLLGTGLRCLDCDVSTVAASGTDGVSYAIYASDATSMIAVNNRMSSADYGLYFDGTSSGKYRNNLATGMHLQGYVGGTDAGKNIVDNNNDGIDDDWETAYFGTINVDPNATAPGCGALSILQAYQQGLNPNDYYNGITPVVSIVSGNNQGDAVDVVLSQPLVVKVTKTNGVVQSNAPVTFTLEQGDGALSASATGTFSSATTVNTDGSGQAKVYFKLPSNTTAMSIIDAIAGSAQPAKFRERTKDDSGNSPSTSAPSDINIVLNADGSTDTTWTNNTTNPHPIPIYMKNLNGDWVLVKTVPAGSTSVHITEAEMP